jgi:hypothetical protein
MVGDRITDGKRIAQLLASELDGRSDGPLAGVAVVDADPDVEPAPGGAHAYDVVSGDTTVANVLLHPDSVSVIVPANADAAALAADAPGLRTERCVVGGEGDVDPAGGATGSDETRGVAIVVEYGAAVKGAVDALTAAIEPGA